MMVRTNHIEISVALCTFNGEKYILSQLNSILNQTRLPDEIIICDDNSDDNTLNLISNLIYNSSIDIQIIKNSVRLNVVKNFEKAISLCTGDIIFLCDQDDVWLPDKVETISVFFNQNPKINVVFTNAFLIDDNDSRLTNKTLFDAVNFTGITQKYFTEGFGVELLNIDNRITGATMAMKKEYVSRLFPFPEIDGVVHDELIALSAIIDNSIGFINDCLINYRIHTSQKLGLGVWINSPPDSNVFKYHPVRIEYQNLNLLFNNSQLIERIDFVNERGRIIKSVFGLFLLVISIVDYKKFYSKHAFTVIKTDILDFYKTNIIRLKRLFYA